ncbi:hypothetical protein J1605_008151 [Eschrichtius robustus]|uniref:Uncharacterized protein n=1 Tax=Eschrichtius robustus TaxID=9764 RepID=A0AB34GYI9_ESCRO|nr:hypothetical protein J1605_008151 [Eschrichtius robustus]
MDVLAASSRVEGGGKASDNIPEAHEIGTPMEDARDSRVAKLPSLAPVDKLRTDLQPSHSAQSRDFQAETGLRRPVSGAGGPPAVCERSGRDPGTPIPGSS